MIQKRRRFYRKFHRENWKIMTIPNILTFGRIAVIPFLVLTVFMKRPIGNLIGLVLFILASLTDYADGYIARRFKQVSKFGSFLDPIADKLLITVMLVLLAGQGCIVSFNLIPAVLIVCRELVISGLREFLAAMSLELPVLRLAKWKTTVQMLSIVFFLSAGLFSSFQVLSYTGMWLLWIAGVLSCVTAVSYISSAMTFIKIFRKQEKQAIPKKKRERKLLRYPKPERNQKHKPVA